MVVLREHFYNKRANEDGGQVHVAWSSNVKHWFLDQEIITLSL